jgi:hypothetical protein
MSEELEELEAVIPSMNVNVPTTAVEEDHNLITDDALIGIYGEIMGNLRSDREEIANLTANFVDMVINDGDATTSSKEALVNLVKIKTEVSDKMSKIADLMTRVKLKERDTFPRYLAANQNNTININDSGKRDLLRSIERAQKKKKEENGS